MLSSPLRQEHSEQQLIQLKSSHQSVLTYDGASLAVPKICARLLM